MFSRLFFFAFLIAAATATSDSLLRYLSLSEGSPAFKHLFNPAVANLGASLGIRFLYLKALARYEIAAACDNTALSFFGTKDPISAPLCTPVNRAVIRVYTLYRINREQFPVEAVPFGSYLRRIGLTPDDDSDDTSTPSGWANFAANRANRYLSNDGWNSQGDLSLPEALRNRYSDTTGFYPANKPSTPADELPRPLRWQPLTQKSGFTGGFRSQVFDTPQLGSAKTLALTSSEVARRDTPAPYQRPDSRSLVGTDLRLMIGLITEFLETSRELTVMQRFLARWWENKRISLLSYLPFYTKKLGLTEWQETYIELAQLIAMHDSIVVAWKEKLKHNAVRPTTMIKRFFTGVKIRVFISEKDGVGEILGENYEPLVPVQAHPEYPSGSAFLCTSGLEALEQALREIIRGSIPPYVLRVRPGLFGFPHNESFVVRYSTLSEGAMDCGQSRLWAGVHFPPSVRAGEEAAKGIGTAAYRQMSDLISGIVPRYCPRCL